MSNDLGVIPEFYQGKLELVRESAKQGRPIFQDVDMVRLRYIGDRTRELHAPVTDKFVRESNSGRWLTYADVFASQYEAYKKGLEYQGEGTPLSELPFLTEARRAELRALNIHTLERIVDMPTAARNAMGVGAADIIMKAKAFYEKAKDSAIVTRFASENEELRSQIASMQQQIEALASGKSAPRSAPVEETTGEDEGDFAGFSNDDLKAYIKDQSGAAPRGNPSRETLIRMAEECAAKLRESEDA